MRNFIGIDAADDYFMLTVASYHFGLIDAEQFKERVETCRFLMAREDADKVTWQDLGLENEATEIAWPEKENSLIASETAETRGKELREDADGGIMHFNPAGHTGLSAWMFHKTDVDFFPSVPHGHHLGKKQPKLDPFLGWKYQKSAQFGRESRKNIVALWNDDSFRKFATEVLDWFLKNVPYFGPWRVENPRRLPRKR